MLESIIEIFGKFIVDIKGRSYGRPHLGYSQFEKVDDERYLRVRNNTSISYFDKDGNLVFGSPHMDVSGFKEIDEKSYLLVKDYHNNCDYFVDREGKILQDYGGPHYNIDRFMNLESEKILIVRDELNFLCYYDKEGNKYFSEDHLKTCLKYKKEGISEYFESTNILIRFLNSRGRTEKFKVIEKLDESLERQRSH